jgi:hypothetical protein
MERPTPPPADAPGPDRSEPSPAPPNGEPTPPPPPSKRTRSAAPPELDEIRAYIATRVAEKGALRGVARETGVSATGLQKFLSGGTPYAKTRRRLAEWWMAQEPNLLPALDGEGIEEAIAGMLAAVAPERRYEFRDRLIATLRDLHDAHPDACPPWMGELVSKTQRSAPGADAPAAPEEGR